MNKTLIVF